MDSAAISGWIALAFIPLAAGAGWILRRFTQGRFAIRMRPHHLAGYCALAFALVHLSLTMGSMTGANATGIWLATIALGGLILQSLVGSNLQSPGDYSEAAAHVARHDCGARPGL